jgi:hypothetical protein
MSCQETQMIKKVKYGSLVYETLYNTLIGDALREKEQEKKKINL